MTTLHHGRVGWAELTHDLRLSRSSPSLAALLALDGALRGRSLPEIVPELAAHGARLAAMQAGQLPAIELEAIERPHPDGGRRYLRLLVERVEEERLLCLVEDVTEGTLRRQRLDEERWELQRDNEQLKALNRSKSFILSMLGHDLRTLMTVVLGYADLLLESEAEGLDAPLRRGVEGMRHHATRASQLLTGILDIDALERGALAIHPEPTDFAEAVRAVLRPYEDSALPRARLVLDLPPEPVMVIADPLRLHQVIANLISNAVKYTPDTGVITCTLAAACADEPGHACLAIRDTGMGMNAEQLRQLFQPYYRTANAVQSKVDGAGLGLYIAKVLIEAQAGAITVESWLHEGTRFTLSLPRAATTAP